ncbi:restriction endonuclease fold toxin 5 domain-containing protein [Janthinobacterium sp. MDB2-8]|uniref:restriction endonuclease fold toxin 5 domain-containing protein n=1 Tax=Janthinobacterium sp. MDB2-8 TaxID=1259338 RepID=UPI003F28A49D
MAALAIPAIEAVAARVLVALGVGAVAGAAGDAARKHQKEADQARSSPIARTDAQTKTKEKCKKCPPDSGAPFNRSTAGWSETSIAYQARIAGLPVGSGFITEWMFGGVTFDGFDSSQCVLKEAKAKYDQFFNASGAPQKWWEGDDPIFLEASRQSAVAKPMPPVQLHWYFMEPMSYRYFSLAFVKMLLPIESVYQP